MLNKAPNMYENFVLKKLLTEAKADAEQRKGRLATITYVVAMIVVIVLVCVYYAAKEEMYLLTDIKPTLARYHKFAQYEPDCPCKVTAVTLDKVTHNLIKFNPVCDAAANLMFTCQQATKEAIANNADGTGDVNAVVKKCGVYAGSYSQSLVILKGVNRMCQQAWSLVEEEVKDFRRSQVVTTSLVHNSTFQTQMNSMWSATRTSVVSRFLLPLETTLTLNMMERPVTSFTIGDAQAANSALQQSGGGTAFAFPDCNCYKSYECKMAIPQATGYGGLEVGCSVYQTIQSLDMGQMIDMANKWAVNDTSKYADGLKFIPSGSGRRRRLTDSSYADAEGNNADMHYEEDYGVIKGSADFEGEPESEFAFCEDEPNYFCFYDPGCFYMSKACAELRKAHNGVYGAMSSGPPAVTTGTFSKAISQGFLNSFEVTTDFAIYFDNCHPSKCDYYKYGRLEPAAVVSTVLGLIGGISVGIKAAVGVVYGLDWVMIIGLFTKFCGCCCKRGAAAPQASTATPTAAAPASNVPEKPVELEAVGIHSADGTNNPEQESKNVEEEPASTPAAGDSAAAAAPVAVAAQAGESESASA